MMEKSRVAAHGDIGNAVEYLSPGDIVFFYHKWEGIVAAADAWTGAFRRRQRASIVTCVS